MVDVVRFPLEISSIKVFNSRFSFILFDVSKHRLSCFGGVGYVRGSAGWSIEVRSLKLCGFLIFLPFGLPTLYFLYCAIFSSIVVLLSL